MPHHRRRRAVLGMATFTALVPLDALATEPMPIVAVSKEEEKPAPSKEQHAPVPQGVFVKLYAGGESTKTETGFAWGTRFELLRGRKSEFGYANPSPTWAWGPYAEFGAT